MSQSDPSVLSLLGVTDQVPIVDHPFSAKKPRVRLTIVSDYSKGRGPSAARGISLYYPIPGH